MRQAVTSTPVALPGIAAGTRYAVQNHGRTPIRVNVAAAAPSTDAELADAAIVGGRSGTEVRSGVVRAASGESIYVYTVNPGETSVVWYDEAA